MRSFAPSDNPLCSDSMQVWDDLVTAVGPASLLVLIEQRMGPALRAKHSAEDIFQDALLHAWRDRHACQWEGLKKFRAWLISIIDHRIHDAADFARAERRGGGAPHGRLANPVTSAPGGVMQPMESTTPSRIAVYREQAAAMDEALHSLPADLRDVVRLRLFEQLPVESIASHLGIGVAAVRHRFRKGAELCQQKLQQALLTRSQIQRK